MGSAHLPQRTLPDDVAKAEYYPSPHVLSTSGVSASDLVYCYKDFCASLEYANANREHAFERLVTNLSSASRSQKDDQEYGNRCRLPDDRVVQPPAALLDTINRMEIVTQEIPEAVIQIPSIDNHSLQAQVKEGVSKTSYPAIGSYHTQESEPFSSKIVVKVVKFSRRYDTQPVFPKGFTSLRFNIGSKVVVYAYNGDFKSDCCEVKLEAPTTTMVTGTSCAWLELDPKDENFQCDEASVTGPGWRKAGNGNFLAFPRPYQKPPRVLVWFKKFHVNATNNWRLCTYSSSITTTGFVFQLNGLQDESDYSGIWWVAHPADMPGVCSGTVESAYPFPKLDKTIRFDRVFATPPRVLLVINTIELDCVQDVVVSIATSEVTTTGMTWRIDGLPENTPHRIGASYIALA